MQVTIKFKYFMRWSLAASLLTLTACGKHEPPQSKSVKEQAGSMSEDQTEGSESTPPKTQAQLPQPLPRNSTTTDASLLFDDFDKLVQATLSEDLKDDISREVSWSHIHGDLKLECGEPRLSDGGAINYDNTAYSKMIEQGYFENSYCILAENREGQFALLEYDLGSTDSPALGWIEEYQMGALDVSKD